MSLLQNEKLLIIIPTYNESKNIEKLVDLIFSETGKLEEESADQVHILVVDDNSPDGTADIVKKITGKKVNLHLMERPGKLGLGTAYIQGFTWGMEQGFTHFLEMDADFSHNPCYLRQFISLVPENDVVIGSRYVKGGGVKNWGMIRKILSRGGSFYAKLILGSSVNDFTGGYNLWKKDVLNSIDYKGIISEGYSFQIEMKYKAYKKGFRIREFPIVFEDRIHGHSKMSRKIILEAMVKVWKFRFRGISKKAKE